MEIALLKYYKYEKGNLQTIFFIKDKENPPIKLTDLSSLSSRRVTTIISFDFLNIIDDIDNISSYTFIDIEQQLKQILGLPKSFFEKTKKEWSFWVQIKNHVQDQLEIKHLKKVYENLAENISNDEIDRIFFLLTEYLYKIYEKNKLSLKEKNELKRFEEIEKPLNTILFERTKKGITIDKDLVKHYINQIIIELYEVRNKLQLDYSIFSSKDYSKIKQEILKLNFTDNIDKIGTEKYYNFLKYHQDNFPLIDLLYKERRLNDSKNVLTRLSSLEERKVHPYFEYFGTITSRIIVKNPSFQQLKREYREIILPDVGKKLVYIDYCQFEAGILASEMEDEKLIELYNSGDIYSKMQESLNSKEFNRDKCKSLFFLYSYGASIAQIKKKYTISDLETFFGQFSQFKPYKEKLEKKFKEENSISTLLGNHRNKTPDTEYEEDISWLVSQRIQGTASLILKKVINKIYNVDKEIEFLLPMHDAVLYQVPDSKYKEKKELIKKIFEEELKAICPKLTPKTNFKKFQE